MDRIFGQIMLAIGGLGGLLFLAVALRWTWRALRQWWRNRYTIYTGYDTELFDTEPVESGQSSTLTFFSDNRSHPDGRPKSSNETNMMQSGQLGYPLMFSPKSLELYVECDDAADRLELLKSISVRFCVGQNYSRFMAAGMMFEPVFVFAEGASVGAMKLLYDTKPEIAESAAALTRHFTKSLDLNTLCSAECFEARIEFSKCPKLHGPASLRVALKGTLWGPYGHINGPKTLKIKGRFAEPKYYLAA